LQTVTTETEQLVFVSKIDITCIDKKILRLTENDSKYGVIVLNQITKAGMSCKYMHIWT